MRTLPGPVVTEFQQVAKREGMKPDIGPKFLVVTVEQVVRDALAALEADRPLIIPGFAMKLLMLLARLMPMPVLRWVARMSPRKRGSCSDELRFAFEPVKVGPDVPQIISTAIVSFYGAAGDCLINIAPITASLAWETSDMNVACDI